MKLKKTSTAFFAIIFLFCVVAAQAVTIDLMTVGNPNNAADVSSFGSVDYTYQIGKYEVTNAQYTEFLNAVDINGTNLYVLYNSNMGSGYGGITFTSGKSSGSKYAVISGRGDMAVNWVSFWDACRFTNWLSNGQGNVDTENGSYTLTADGINNNTITRNTNWTWAVASTNEWYKAAYYDPNRSGGAGYWLYPTCSNNAPSATEPPGDNTGNGSANYNNAVGDLTNVGAYTYKPSTSPYGTYDQGGNVGEWTETVVVDSLHRNLRGGTFLGDTNYMAAYSQYIYLAYPTFENYDLGFRVASVPEPGSITLLVCGVIAGLMWRRRTK